MREKKNYLFVIILIIVGIIFNINSIKTNNIENYRELNLLEENNKMKKSYHELENKFALLNEQINQIYQYDYILYNKLLGVDFDTTGFSVYNKPEYDSVINDYNYMFSDLNDRALNASKMLALQIAKIENTSEYFQEKKSKFVDNYPTISPVKTKDFIKISSPYGWRVDPIKKKTMFHDGVDISALRGTNVHATADGVIVEVKYSKYGYGNKVVIKHMYGFETLYAHLYRIHVKKGDRVKKNDVIGTVGSTGKSTNPHLHYEIVKNNEPRDPLGYFYTYLTENLLALK